MRLAMRLTILGAFSLLFLSQASWACAEYTYHCGYGYNSSTGTYDYHCGYQYWTNLPETGFNVSVTGHVSSAASGAGLISIVSVQRAGQGAHGVYSNAYGDYQNSFQDSACNGDSLTYTICAEAPGLISQCTNYNFQVNGGGNVSTAANFSLISTNVPDYALKYLTGLYRDLLDRGASSDELNFWATLLRGTTRATIAQAFLSSGEYRGRLVQSYYQKYLGRMAGQSDINYWVSNFQAFKTDEALLSQLIGSGEYYARAGSTADGFVSALYHDFLGRDAEPSGISYWKSVLTHQSRQAVALSFLQTSEYRSSLIQQWFESYLHRAADANAVQSFLGALNAGQPDEWVQSAILASGEYLNLQ